MANESGAIAAAARRFSRTSIASAGCGRELSDTVTLELVPLSGARPAFEPGQFNMLYVFGVGEVAISVSGDRANEDASYTPSAMLAQ